MTSAHSETTTVVSPDEYTARHDSDNTQPTNSLEKTLSKTHDSRRPDISFPYETTDINRGGLTDEYRAVTEAGFVPADTALRPIPSRLPQTPQALRDPEKAQTIKDVKFVTWKPDDPEDPRNWSNTYRWCE